MQMWRLFAWIFIKIKNIYEHQTGWVILAKKRVDCLDTAVTIKTQASINGPGFVRCFVNCVYFGSGQID